MVMVASASEGRARNRFRQCDIDATSPSSGSTAERIARQKSHRLRRQKRTRLHRRVLVKERVLIFLPASNGIVAGLTDRLNFGCFIRDEDLSLFPAAVAEQNCAGSRFGSFGLRKSRPHIETGLANSPW